VRGVEDLAPAPVAQPDRLDVRTTACDVDVHNEEATVRFEAARALARCNVQVRRADARLGDDQDAVVVEWDA